MIEVDHLHKTYALARGQRLDVLHDVSFSVPTNGALGIVGESGAGKSTIARILAGLDSPTSGVVRVDEEDRSAAPRSKRTRRRRGGQLQIVFQDPYTSLDPRQTAMDSVNEVLTLHTDLNRTARRRRASELLDQVGLDLRSRVTPPRSLSGGQCQRVAIAKALAAQPKVLLLDEAVSALDVSIQAQILNLLATIREEHELTYVLISHDLAVVRQLCDDVVVLRHGAVVEHGVCADVLDYPSDPYTQLLRESVPRAGWSPSRSSDRGMPIRPRSVD